jgi:hypothetical protein
MTDNDRVRWWITFRDTAEAHGLDPLQILEAAEELRLAGQPPYVAVTTLTPKQHRGEGRNIE